MPLITRKLGGVYPRQSLDLGREPAAHLPHVIARVKGGCMRTISLDLAVLTAHKAVILNQGGHFCSSILTVHTRPSELSHLLARVRAHPRPRCRS